MNINAQNQPVLPLPGGQDDNDTANQAANMIRHKLDNLYSKEPDAVTEAIESVQATPQSRSPHQRFMAELAASGKPFSEIQNDWHAYYNNLNNREKHEVWQEFYASQQHHTPPANGSGGQIQPVATIGLSPVLQPKSMPHIPPAKPHSVADLKQQIIQRVKGRSKMSRKAHIKSLGFGLGAGAVMVLILLFGFFNERFIAPFITPSRNVSSTPIIFDPNGMAVGSEPKLIIPKINVEVPVVYDVETIEEEDVQKGLERGVVHYATTPNPGEQGNATIFGHSSNNILNRGAYKFVFVFLKRMEIGDTFYIEKDGVRYIYKVFEKKIVSPDEVSVLENHSDKTSTVSLITCDPPGTTVNRLVVIGEQITPDPIKNLASTALQTDTQPEVLAGNPESLWSRMWHFAF